MTSEKLDILMKITDTRNSTLGRALSFDPSYIGRIRAGKRGIPKHMPFIEPAAAFFSKNIKTDYQKKLISELVFNSKALPSDNEELKKNIAEWLKKDVSDKPDSSSVALLLHELSYANPSNSAASEFISSTEYILTDETPSYFFGNSGKREAAELFLKKLCADQKPHRLMLFSDEDMTWLYEDPLFTKKWAGYLIRLLSTGSQIKIIHTINRNLNDLMEAVHKWLPLYIAGDIEPYYYPKLRDGIYHRTLFLAANKFAITSDSIGNSTEGMPNIFIEDANALAGLEKEFNNYLSLCTPLMKMHKKNTKEIIPLLLERFKDTENEMFYVYAPEDNQDSEKAGISKYITDFIDSHPKATELVTNLNQIPENISIFAGINSGILIITDKLIFDTLQPDFTMTFLEYLFKIQKKEV